MFIVDSGHKSKLNWYTCTCTWFQTFSFGQNKAFYSTPEVVQHWYDLRTTEAHHHPSYIVSNSDLHLNIFTSVMRHGSLGPRLWRRPWARAVLVAETCKKWHFPLSLHALFLSLKNKAYFFSQRFNVISVDHKTKCGIGEDIPQYQLAFNYFADKN